MSPPTDSTSSRPRLLRTIVILVGLAHLLLSFEVLTVRAYGTVQVSAAERAFEEGERLLKQGDAKSVRAAVKKYRDALESWHSAADKRGELKALLGIATVYYRLDEHENAFGYYDGALHLSRVLGDHSVEAQALNGMGNVRLATGDAAGARGYYTRSLEPRRAADNRVGEAYTLANIGATYWSEGEPRKALQYHNQTLSIMRDLAEKDGQAYALYNIGLVYASLSENTRALEYYNQALTLQRDTKDQRAEAATLNGMGLVQSALGENQSALNYYEQALSLRRAVGHQSGEAVTLRNIGDLHTRLGETEKALEYFKKAVPLMKASGDRRNHAYTLDNIGVIYWNLSLYDKALSNFKQALTLFRATGHKTGVATTLEHIGSTHFVVGENQKAIERYDEALSLFREVGDRPGEARVLIKAGEVLARLGRLHNAHEHYDKALSLARSIEDRAVEASALYKIALLERDRGELQTAYALIARARGLAEFVRVKVDAQELRASYLASVQDYYDLEIDILMRLHQSQPSRGFDGVALQISESSRARSLIETLGESRVDINEGMGPRLVEPLTAKQIQQQVLDEGTLLLEYALGKDRSFLWAATPSSIRSFEVPRRTEVEAVARQLYGYLTARNSRPSGETAEQRSRRLARADAQYLKTARTLSNMLLGPVARELGSKRLLIVAGGALQYIPFAALPVPDHKREKGQAAEEGFRPLIMDHEIVNLPSASTLVVLKSEAVGRPPAKKTLAVFADPVFERDDSRVKPRARNHQESPATNPGAGDANKDGPSRAKDDMENADQPMPRLIFSSDEAQGILTLVPMAQRKQALGFEASRAAALSPELGEYRIVHFATHSVVDTVRPERSGVLLSRVDEDGERQNGLLRLHEIYNLKLSADLVVLSGCETALGKEIRGEGIVGITRGFMHAGSPRVVASLWKIDDRSTATLMKLFYEHMLVRGLPPAAALRAAQIEMLRKTSWSNPYYWAAFVLQGEWR